MGLRNPRVTDKTDRARPKSAWELSRDLEKSIETRKCFWTSGEPLLPASESPSRANSDAAYYCSRAV